MAMLNNQMVHLVARRTTTSVASSCGLATRPTRIWWVANVDGRSFHDHPLVNKCKPLQQTNWKDPPCYVWVNYGKFTILLIHGHVQVRKL